MTMRNSAGSSESDRYHQLNRLMEARGYDGLDNTNLWANATISATNLFKSTYRYDANGNMERIERYDQHGDWYVELSYFYQNSGAHRVRNRLYHVTDSKDAADAYVNQTPDGFEDYPYQAAPAIDLNDNLATINTSNNYSYDALGNLVRDDLEDIENIDWTLAGKVRGVQHEDGNGDKDLLFSYGADGQRIVKEVQDDLGNFETRSYYIRDAQGNVMAHYTYDRVTGSFKVTERPMYGSSRLGVDNYTLELCGLDLNDYDPLNDPAGEQRYELTDQLGNVTTVVTDEVVGVNSDGVTGYEYFQPQVVSASGYEPFGSLLPGRNFSSASYRFGFQGQEKDDEIHGATGTSYNYEYRMHDSRIGRFLSIDPLAKKYAWNSPYAFSENRVIDAVELEGLESEIIVHFLQKKWDGRTMELEIVDEVTIPWHTTQFAIDHPDSEGHPQFHGPEGYGATHFYFSMDTKTFLKKGFYRWHKTRPSMEFKEGYRDALPWEWLDKVFGAEPEYKNSFPIEVGETAPGTSPPELEDDPYFGGQTNPQKSKDYIEGPETNALEEILGIGEDYDELQHGDTFRTRHSDRIGGTYDIPNVRDTTGDRVIRDKAQKRHPLIDPETIPKR